MDVSAFLNKMKKNWIASAIVTAVIGLLLVLFPGKSLEFISYCVGFVAVVMGVTRTVRYFKQDHTYPFLFQSDLVAGLISAGLGLFLITQPKTVINLVPHIFGILLVGCGVGNILRAVDAKKAGISTWGVLLALAIVSIVLGVVIMGSPFETMEISVILIGSGLIYEGITDLITTLMVGKRIDSWKKSAAQ